MMIHSVRRVIFRRSCLQERTGPKHNTTGSQPDFVGSCTNMLMDSNAFKAGLKDALQKQAMDLGRNSSSSPGASSSPSPSASCSSTRSESHVACLKSAKCTDIIGSVSTHHKAVTQLDCLSDKKWQAFLTLSLASFRQALLSSRGAPTAWPSSSGPESSSGGGKRRWQASGTKPQKFCNTAICLTHGATFVPLVHCWDRDRSEQPGREQLHALRHAGFSVCTAATANMNWNSWNGRLVLQALTWQTEKTICLD